MTWAADSRWWSQAPDERYWLEITDRLDLGVDLHCPQADARGGSSPGYWLINEIEPGDVVFHYDTHARAIIGCSVATGWVVAGETSWVSHRGATRRRVGTHRVVRPGWFLDLDGMYPLTAAVSLDALRERASDVMSVKAALDATHPGVAHYFPFYLYRGQLRPMQPYLNKLPASMVDLFDELKRAAGRVSAGSLLVSTPPLDKRASGGVYRRAAASSTSERDLYAVDAALVERGLIGHAETQNAVAARMVALGLAPLSPALGDPNYDVACQTATAFYVVEVKSITAANAERQMRLALGQILRYRSLLEAAGHSPARGVIVTEVKVEGGWDELCSSVGVAVIARNDLPLCAERVFI